MINIDSKETPVPELPVPHNLGVLPSQLDIQWPGPPQTMYPFQISSPIEISSPLEGRIVQIDQAHTRVFITVNLEQLTLAASDIDVEVNENVHIDTVYIHKELSRIRVKSGRFGRIELAVPADFNQEPVVYRAEWLVQDVLIDSVTIVNSTSSAFLLRGKRIAILNSYVQAFHYSVWVEDTTDFHNEDIILANNVFESAGPEATVRLVSVVRSVVVDNRFINFEVRTADNETINKHNYRIHGRSDLNYAARNSLIKRGLMIGTMEGDDLGTIWFLNNFIFHITPSLLEADNSSKIKRFIVTGNTIFSEVWDCFLCRNIPETWIFANNYIRR